MHTKPAAASIALHHEDPLVDWGSLGVEIERVHPFAVRGIGRVGRGHAGVGRPGEIPAAG